MGPSTNDIIALADVFNMADTGTQSNQIEKYYERCCTLTCTINDGSTAIPPTFMTIVELPLQNINNKFGWQDYTITSVTDSSTSWNQ